MLRVFCNFYRWLLVVCMCTTMLLCGCSLRRAQQPNCCPPYISQRSDFQESKKPADAGIVSDLDSIANYETVRSSTVHFLNAESPAQIDLSEVLCAAAGNSELAELIEAERHALQCRVNDGNADCNPSALDRMLHGEAQEQRNKAAGAASTLFLRLVEIELQRVLLQESEHRLAQLNETLEGAANEGFATAAGEIESANGRIRLLAMKTKLDTSEQLLNCQLNGLINKKTLNRISPVYELKPAHLNLDMESEIHTAESTRPGILALESALAGGSQPEAILEFFGLSEMRSGLQPSSNSIAKRILRRKMIAYLNSNIATNSTANRRAQLTQLLEGRKHQARTEASMALIKIQGSIEKLAIANEKFEKLNARGGQLHAKQELDSQDAYLEIVRNWFDVQAAKSERITAAIEHDTAVVELLQAQGMLVQECNHNQNTCPNGSQCPTQTP